MQKLLMKIEWRMFLNDFVELCDHEIEKKNVNLIQNDEQFLCVLQEFRIRSDALNVAN